MTNTIYRPDPPSDISGNRRVQRASQVQNDEAHTRLFERALVRAEAERRSEGKTIDRASDKQHQIDRDNDVLSSLRRIETNLSSPPDSVVDAEPLNDEQLAADDDSGLNHNESDNDVSTTASLFFPDLGSATDRQGTSEMFQKDHSGIDSSQNFNSEQTFRVGAEQTNVNSLAGQNEFVERSDPGISDLIDLSSLYELVQSGLSGLNEWSFTFEDDGPVSELTLSREDNGSWRVGLTAPTLNVSGDSSVLDILQHRLEDIGLAVSSVSVTRKDKPL